MKRGAPWALIGLAILCATRTSWATAAETPPSWYARLGLGIGFAFESDQNELLRKDGYDNQIRWWLLLEGTWVFSKHVGVGGFAGGTYRQSGAALESPTLTDLTPMIGLQLPVLVLQETDYLATVTPRIGLGHNSLSLHRRGEFVAGLAYGGELGFVFREAHLGLSLGAMSGQVDVPSELGASYNFGGVYLLFGGALDG